MSNVSPLPKFNPVIHAQHRLQLCALLADVDAVDFPTARQTLGISESSLSKQVKRLSEEGYIEVSKRPHGVRTRTWLSLTNEGREAYLSHLAELRRIVGADQGA